MKRLETKATSRSHSIQTTPTNLLKLAQVARKVAIDAVDTPYLKSHLRDKGLSVRRFSETKPRTSIQQMHVINPQYLNFYHAYTGDKLFIQSNLYALRFFRGALPTVAIAVTRFYQSFSLPSSWSRRRMFIFSIPSNNFIVTRNYHSSNI